MTASALTQDAELWAFLLAIYRQPGVQEICLDLQERYDADIVLVLICVFYMRPGQIALGAARIAELQAEVAEWRERAILPLRRLRVELRNPGALQETERMALRDKIKTLELEAERTEVRLIAASLTRCPPCPTAPTEPDAGLALLLGSPTAAMSPAIAHLRQASLSISQISS